MRRPILAMFCVLAGMACGRSVPQAGETADPSTALLERIVAAQKGRTHVQGRLRQEKVRADQPEDRLTTFVVQFYLELPDRYHLCLWPEKDDGGRDWFVSDGTWAWMAHRDDVNSPCEVRKKSVQKDGNSPWIRLAQNILKLDHHALAKDFTIQAREIPISEKDNGFGPKARYAVTVVPRSQDLREHCTEATVAMDESFHTVAVHIRDQNGNLTRETVLEADYDKALPKDIFTWPEPKSGGIRGRKDEE